MSAREDIQSCHRRIGQYSVGSNVPIGLGLVAVAHAIVELADALRARPVPTPAPVPSPRPARPTPEDVCVCAHSRAAHHDNQACRSAWCGCNTFVARAYFETDSSGE